MANGQDEAALAVLSHLRRLPSTSELVQLEYLEIKAQHMFEVETSIAKFPDYQSGGFLDNLKLGFFAYTSLLTNRSLRKRVFVAVMIMVFQQCQFHILDPLFQCLQYQGPASTLFSTTQRSYSRISA